MCLPVLAVAMAVGIVLADRGLASSAVLGLLAVAALAAGGRAASHPRRRFAAAALLALVAGAQLHARQLGQKPAIPSATRDVTLEGVVSERGGLLAPRWLRLERVSGVESGGVPSRSLVFPGEPGSLDALHTGARIRLRARIGPLRPARNPGAADRDRRYRRRGLAVGGPLLHSALVVERPAHRTTLRRLDALRVRLAEGLARAGEGSELLRGLALGDRGGLVRADRESFVRLGLAHALAVSGLHLVWVASVGFAVTRRALRTSRRVAERWEPRTIAWVAACAASLGYAALAGWGVPVRRALVLLGAGALAASRRRPQRAAPVLAAAALWILAREPAALFELGAQLSFAAVAALVFAARRQPRGRWGTRALRRTATAVAVTTPILAWHGAAVAPIALLANAVALPWIGGVVLPAALASTAAVAFALPGQETILAVAAWLAARTLEALAGAAHWLPNPAPRAPSIASWIAIVGLAALALALRPLSGRLAAAGLAAVAAATAPPAPIEPPVPRLVVLEVGQGDAALVQGRRGSVLIDAGAARPGGSDAGRVRVLPSLAALGVERLDLVVVTHADLDHRGGIPAVLESLAVGELWLPFGAAAEPAFRDLREAAAAARVPVRERGRGSPIRSFGDLKVEPLWPPGSPSPSWARNAGSLVVRIAAEGARVLAPGDLEASAEAALVATGAELAAEVLLLPHHGSRSSSSPRLLDAVSPLVAVSSAPCAGRFGMPHAEVRERLRARGVPLWWTGRDGAVLIHLGRAVSAHSMGPPRTDCGGSAPTNAP